MSRATAAAATAAPAVKTTSKSKTVTVASKLPMSIILQLCKPQTAAITGQFGSVKETVYVPTGMRVVARGVAQPNGQIPKGYVRPKLTSEQEDPEAFALTPNVDREFFEAWLEQNKDTDMVRNGLIFAQPTVDEAIADAADRKGLRTGFEPLDPEGNDPRRPRPANPLVGEVGKDTGAA